MSNPLLSLKFSYLDLIPACDGVGVLTLSYYCHWRLALESLWGRHWIPALHLPGRWYYTTFFFKWCTQRRCFPSSGLPKLVILAWGTSSITMQREVTRLSCSVKPLVLPANCKWWWVTALILSVLLPNLAKHFTHKALDESPFFPCFFQMIQYYSWIVEEGVRMWLEKFVLLSLLL